MSSVIRRWLPLAAAVLAVAAVLYVLQARTRSRERSADEPAAGGALASAGKGTPGSTGVAARETTVSGAGWVRGQVVDEDGAVVEEGRLVLWCLGVDHQVARIEGGVLELDAEGRFSGPACRGERVCVELHHPALVPAEPWSLPPGTEATLEARQLPRLSGRVIDSGGEPVAGAAVGLQLPLEEDDPGAVLPVVTSQTSTDADGEFSVALVERPPCDPCRAARQACAETPLPVADRVLVTARAPGWAPGSRVIELGEADPDAPVEVVLRPAAAAITGTLVDARGHALPRAFVLARSRAQPRAQHRAEADDGTFALEGLGDGPHALRVIQDGRELLRREGVLPGASLALELPVALCDVVLELVDAQGHPRADVEVDGGPFVRQRTDADGRVRAQRVAPGPYILRIRVPGEPARAYDLEIPDAASVGEGDEQDGPPRSAQSPETARTVRLEVAGRG